MLWLKDENSPLRGWVRASEAIPYEQAVDFYTTEIKAKPSATLFAARGSVFGLRKELDRSLTDFNETIRLDPRHVSAYYNRGTLWLLKKDFDKAIADFGEAIRIDPGHALAYNNRAWLRAACPDDKFRDGEKAVEDAIRACTIDKFRSPNFMATLAAAHAEAGDFEKAVEWQRKVIQANPDGERTKRDDRRLNLYKGKRAYRFED